MSGGLIREWRRRDSFEETDSSDGDPLEQTTNPRDLAAAVAASRVHNLRQTTNPAELKKAIAMSRASSEESEKKRKESSENMAEVGRPSTCEGERCDGGCMHDTTKTRAVQRSEPWGHPPLRQVGRSSSSSSGAVGKPTRHSK